MSSENHTEPNEISNSILNRLGKITLAALVSNSKDDFQPALIIDQLVNQLRGTPITSKNEWKFFLSLLKATDRYLGDDRAFSLLETHLIDSKQYSAAMAAYIFLLSNYRYNARIAQKIANLSRNRIPTLELSAEELWMLAHSLYLNKDYKQLSILSRDLRSKNKKYERNLTQYLMFDTESEFCLDPPVLTMPLVDSEWFIPKHFGARCVPVFACDTKYFSAYILPKLNTKSVNEANVHIAVADPTEDDKQFLAFIQSRSSTFSYSLHSLSVRLNQEINEDKNNGRERRLTFYSILRFLIAGKILEDWDVSVVTLDSDSTLDFSILEHFAETISKVDADIAFKVRKFDYSPGTSHEADVVFFRNSDEGIAFCTRLNSYISAFLGSRYCFWTLDQVALNATTVRSAVQGHRLRFTNLHTLDSFLNKHYRNLGGHLIRNSK